MASRFPKDNLTRGLARDVEGKILVNLDESASWDAEATDNDQATRGLLRDADGAVLVHVTGLPGSVASGDDLAAEQDARTAGDAATLAAVPALVAADPTIAAGASAAVSNAVAGLDVLQAKTVTPDEDIAFSVTDTSGHRSWVEATSAGRPSALSSSLIGQSLSLLDVQSDTVAGAITDSQGRVALAWDLDGKIAERTARRLSAQLAPRRGPLIVPEVAASGKLFALNTATNVRTLIAPAAGTPRDARGTDDGWVHWTDDTGRWARPADGSTAAVPEFGASTAGAQWGDSLTAGIIPGIVASDLGVAVYNGGVAGQASADIALRQGALTPLLTVTDDQIPASGTATVTAISPSAGWRQEGVPNFAFTGTLAGVPGTLKHNITDAPAGTWSFTRTADGSAVACPAGTPFITDIDPAYRDRWQILWAGRNNLNASNDINLARRDLAAMSAWLRPYAKRYLIVGVTNALNEVAGTSNHAQIVKHNAALAETFGDRFFDVRAWMVANAASILTTAGLTPTTQDLADIAADTIPTQLHSDNLHFTTVGATAIAHKLSSIVTAKGWVLA